MTGLMIRPETVTGAVLTATDAVESVAAWNSGTTYSAGQDVSSTATNRVYRSAIDGNLNNDPTNAANQPDKWIDLRPTNPWAMFDEKKSTRTTRADSLEWELTPGRWVNSIGLARISGSTVQIVVNDGSSDVYDQTFSLVSVEGITDWYSWFFQERIQEDTLIVTDLPTVENPVITVTITATGSTAAVGACAIGRTLDIGEPLMSPQLDYNDWSSWEEDGFGGLQVVQRGYSYNVEVQLLIPKNREKYVRQQVLSYRATPVFFVLSTDRTILTHFGFAKSFPIEIAYHDSSLATLRVDETLEVE